MDATAISLPLARNSLQLLLQRGTKNGYYRKL
jgi:hypothetical protein